MRKIWLLLAFFASFFSAFAQIDDLFWFAAPDITSGHAHNPMTFCFTSFANPATVVISQPANPSFTPVTVHLNPYSYYALDVTAQESIVETAPHNTVCNYGFKVVSDQKITCYYQLGANNSEIYTLKGRNALGTNFVVPMENYLNTGSFTPSAYSSIEIVATENNTSVIIIPSQPLLGGLPAGVPITIMLNQGQSYCIKSASLNGSAHLTNTRITSDKPIAVNSSDDSAASNSFSGYSGQDLVGEQIVPVDYAGDLFIALWNNRAFEGITISPTENNTHVYINGNPTPAATLNIGQSYTYMLNQSPTIATMITSDKPIFVFQLTGSDGECGGTVLPAIGCTGSNEVVYARPSYSTHLKLSVLCHTADIGHFTLNNSTTALQASDFTMLPYDPTWSYAYKDFSSSIPVQTVMKLSNDQGMFHLGILDYYTGMSSSLGFFSGYNSNGTIRFMMNDKYCAHDNIEFEYQTRDIDTVHLITPSGDTLTQEPFILNDISPADTGWYCVTGHSVVGCDGTWVNDSIYIQIIHAPKPNLGPDIEYCHGEMGVIESNYNYANVNYLWNTGDTTPDILVVSEGDYILNVAIVNQGTAGACENSDTIHVTFNPQPRVDFDAEPKSGCAPLRVNLINQTQPEPNNFTYLWSVWDEEGTLVYQSVDSSTTFDLEDAGTYTVKLWAQTDKGCVDSLTKYQLISSYLQPSVDFVANPEIAFITGNGAEVEFTPYFSEGVEGNPSVTINWDFGDGDQNGDIHPTHTYTTWGDYIATLTVNTAEGCGAEISHIVIVDADLVFPNVITPNGDGINDAFYIGNLNPNINPEDPDNYRTNELFIYDRWGKQVFHAKDYDTYEKDGQVFLGSNPFTGDGHADGVYYYSFYYKGHYKETKYHGSITIVR